MFEKQRVLAVLAQLAKQGGLKINEDKLQSLRDEGSSYAGGATKSHDSGRKFRGRYYNCSKKGHKEHA
ncbi:hypothetical protein J1N35_035814 [Gossypium stocksii]|uniref:Uncharacterized protein n=1 Tax=Gossypium stocksii TaxID=47602 RepID=A0A9D3UVD7_9ROSI|nr:hypothetical protein J1N35_035814 [Gossypium stocksii]